MNNTNNNGSQNSGIIPLSAEEARQLRDSLDMFLSAQDKDPADIISASEQAIMLMRKIMDSRSGGSVSAADNDNEENTAPVPENSAAAQAEENCRTGTSEQQSHETGRTAVQERNENKPQQTRNMPLEQETGTAAAPGVKTSGSDLFEIFTGKTLTGICAAVFLILGFTLIAQNFSFGPYGKFIGMFITSAGMIFWGCRTGSAGRRLKRVKAVICGIGASLLYTTLYAGCFIFDFIPNLYWIPLLFLWALLMAWLTIRQHPFLSLLAQIGIVINLPFLIYYLIISSSSALLISFAAQLPFYYAAARKRENIGIYTCAGSAMLMLQYLFAADPAAVNTVAGCMLPLAGTAAASASAWFAATARKHRVCGYIAATVNSILVLDIIRSVFCGPFPHPAESLLSRKYLELIPEIIFADTAHHTVTYLPWLAAVLSVILYIAILATEYTAGKLKYENRRIISTVLLAFLISVAFNLSQLTRECFGLASGFILEFLKLCFVFDEYLQPNYGEVIEHEFWFTATSQLQMIIPILSVVFAGFACVSKNRICTWVAQMMVLFCAVPWFLHSAIRPDTSNSILFQILFTAAASWISVRSCPLFSRAKTAYPVVIGSGIAVFVLIFMSAISVHIHSLESVLPEHGIYIAVTAVSCLASWICLMSGKKMKETIPLPAVWILTLYGVSRYFYAEYTGLMLFAAMTVLLEFTRHLLLNRNSGADGYYRSFRLSCIIAATLLYLKWGDYSYVCEWQRTGFADAPSLPPYLCWLWATAMLLWIYFSDIVYDFRNCRNRNVPLYYCFGAIAAALLIMTGIVQDNEMRCYLLYPIAVAVFILGHQLKNRVLEFTSLGLFALATVAVHCNYYGSFTQDLRIPFNIFVFLSMFMWIRLTRSLLSSVPDAGMIIFGAQAALALLIMPVFSSMHIIWIWFIPIACHMLMYWRSNDKQEAFFAFVYMWMFLIQAGHIGIFTLQDFIPQAFLMAIGYSVVSSLQTSGKKVKFESLPLFIGITVFISLVPMISFAFNLAESLFRLATVHKWQYQTDPVVIYCPALITCCLGCMAAGWLLTIRLKKNLSCGYGWMLGNIFVSLVSAGLIAVYALELFTDASAAVPDENDIFDTSSLTGNIVILLLIGIVLWCLMISDLLKNRGKNITDGICFRTICIFEVGLGVAVVYLLSYIPTGISTLSLLQFAAMCLIWLLSVPYGQTGYFKSFYFAGKCFILLAVLCFELLRTGNIFYSSLCLTFAVVYLAAGLLKENKIIRIVGLCSTALWILKLILHDISYSSELGKALAYIAAGLILLGICVSYNYMRKSPVEASEPNSRRDEK